MPTTARISTSVPLQVPSASKSKDKDSDASQLVAVSLFSAIGLLISLVAVICGVQGAWF
jgi:hypothetical protein